jgi:hypothetical protein
MLRRQRHTRIVSVGVGVDVIVAGFAAAALVAQGLHCMHQTKGVLRRLTQRQINA